LKTKLRDNRLTVSRPELLCSISLLLPWLWSPWLSGLLVYPEVERRALDEPLMRISYEGDQTNWWNELDSTLECYRLINGLVAEKLVVFTQPL